MIEDEVYNEIIFEFDIGSTNDNFPYYKVIKLMNLLKEDPSELTYNKVSNALILLLALFLQTNEVSGEERSLENAECLKNMFIAEISYC